MAAPNDQYISGMTPENESITNEEESKADDMILDDDPTVHQEGSDTSRPELENSSVANEVEDSSSTNVISTNGELRFLSLPAELRVLTYRHLLVENNPLSMYWPGQGYQSFPAILNTCTLIRREAFQVLFGENIFRVGILHPRLSILSNRQVSDTIQNLHLDMRLNDTTTGASQITRVRFIHLIREFGSPAIVRGTLNIVFRVSLHSDDLVFWLGRSLPRFTNFRSIHLEYVADSAQHPRFATRRTRFCSPYRNFHRDCLTPILGPAEVLATGVGLRFRPQQYLNSLPPEVDVDPMDYLDGIRLDWNQDPPTNVDEPETSTRNTNLET